jgi:acetyl esterase/lipase
MKKEKGPLNSENILTSNNNNNIDDSLPTIYRDKVPDKNNKRNYVSVTILHKEKIYFKDEKDESMFSSFFGFFKSNEPEKKIENKFRKNTIIIAIHGGGFIGSSTLLHERYLRKWSNMLNIPIFGMNYSLAPKYQYPEPLNDIYQGYMWILKHAKEELNMDIKHIILSGDSAGGNIVLGLNNLLIAMKEYEPELGKNIILPELVMAQYPVTYVNQKTFSNSFLLSLHSSMLNINGMKFMYEKYVGKYENEDEDPFLNLIKINDFILDRITNKIRIFFGSQDVLRDDAIKFLYSLSKYNNKEDKKNNIDVRGYELLYLGHGFNGFNEEIQQIGRNVVFPEIEEFLNNISE